MVKLLSKSDVVRVLAGAERELMTAVAEAYRKHHTEGFVVPHSCFLRFPETRNRIIALPAFVEGDRSIAGIKWIASFPGNIERGIDRATALITVNDTSTGLPIAVMEGATISAARTAASAALAASTLHVGPIDSIGVIACGRIQREIVNFLTVVAPECRNFRIFDIDRSRAEGFAKQLGQNHAQLKPEIHDSAASVFEDSAVVSIATNATEAHLTDDLPVRATSTVLHISLRDFTASSMAAFDHVVDDRSHVLREHTSLHEAVLSGHEDPIRTTIGEVLAGQAKPRDDDRRAVMFSPFGLGFLDLVLADFVLQRVDHNTTAQFDFMN